MNSAYISPSVASSGCCTTEHSSAHTRDPREIFLSRLCRCREASPPTYAYTFQPFQALSAFQGKAAAGTWSLEFCDRASGDTGTINQWSLYFQSIDGVGVFPPSQSAASCPGEPVTYDFDLFNATAAPLTADLAYSSTFPASGPATVGPVGVGTSAPFSVEVTPVSTAQFPTTDTLTVNATAGALTSSATAATSSRAPMRCPAAIARWARWRRWRPALATARFPRPSGARRWSS